MTELEVRSVINKPTLDEYNWRKGEILKNINDLPASIDNIRSFQDVIQGSQNIDNPIYVNRGYFNIYLNAFDGIKHANLGENREQILKIHSEILEADEKQRDRIGQAMAEKAMEGILKEFKLDGTEIAELKSHIVESWNSIHAGTSPIGKNYANYIKSDRIGPDESVLVDRASARWAEFFGLAYPIASPGLKGSSIRYVEVLGGEDRDLFGDRTWADIKGLEKITFDAAKLEKDNGLVFSIDDQEIRDLWRKTLTLMLYDEHKDEVLSEAFNRSKIIEKTIFELNELNEINLPNGLKKNDKHDVVKFNKFNLDLHKLLAKADVSSKETADLSNEYDIKRASDVDEIYDITKKLEADYKLILTQGPGKPLPVTECVDENKGREFAQIGETNSTFIEHLRFIICRILGK